ncbi:unnamed protein product, partial [Prorocentrum cordatum]
LHQALPRSPRRHRLAACHPSTSGEHRRSETKPYVGPDVRAARARLHTKWLCRSGQHRIERTRTEERKQTGGATPRLEQAVLQTSGELPTVKKTARGESPRLGGEQGSGAKVEGGIEARTERGQIERGRGRARRRRRSTPRRTTRRTEDSARQGCAPGF